LINKKLKSEKAKNIILLKNNRDFNIAMATGQLQFCSI